ncbi:MAG: hypothetical protein HY694_18600 [Deltaproteobacteria bacterium]|nr:hypothetical protein [Deltaproteobacteria bacterium]
MANETAARRLVVMPGLPKTEHPEQLVPQVRSQIRILKVNIAVLGRELGVEGATLALEVPSEKGVDKAKLDSLLNTKVKPAYDRITLLDFLLSVETGLLADLKQAHLPVYMEALQKEREELVAACKKECEEPIAELDKEIREIVGLQAAAKAQATGKQPGAGAEGQAKQETQK